MPLRYRFGRFELLPETREVLQDSMPLGIGTRAFDLLHCLIEHHDRVVEKDELMQRVWPSVVVGDNNLNVQVSSLRKILGAQAVVTVAGHGYRFGLELLPPAIPGERRRSQWSPPLPLPDKPSVAVLPFLNLSDDPQQDCLVDGVAEDITIELSRFHSLFVISRNSAFTYKGRTADARTVSRELGVRYVVEGSVRRVGRRVRVVAQLIDAMSGEHVWAEKYDRVVDDIFELQEEVTLAIVAAMAPQIDSAAGRRAGLPRSDNLTAHGLAQRAWTLASAGDMAYDRAPRDEAMRWAGEALTVDSSCALALRTIALVQWWHAYHHTTESMADTLALGLTAADSAIALDHGDHHARRWRGLLLAMSGDPLEGLAELRLAHQINPNCALTLGWLGLYEAMHGDEARGVPLALQALRLSPRDPARGTLLVILAFAQFAVADYAAAVDSAQAALRETPGAATPFVVWAIGLIGIGQIDLAKTAFCKLQEIAPKLAEARLAGHWLSTNPGYLKRAQTFLRIAAGLEDPAAADALR